MVSDHFKPVEMKKELLCLGKDSIIYGVGSVITRFVGVFTLPLFTAYLTPEEYGVLAMLAMLSMVAQPLFSLGLSAAMGPSYFEKDDLANKSRAVWSVFVINIGSASLLVLIAWLFPVSLGALVRLPAEYSHLVGLSLTGTALVILVTAFRQRVQFEKQARLYVVISVSTAFVAIIVSIYTVVFLGFGVAGMVYGQLAGNLVAFLAFLAVGIIATIPIFSSRMVKDVLQLGVPLVPSFVFLFIIMHVNKYILEWHSGLEAVGVYSIGFNLGMAISVVTGGIATAWYPFFMSYMSRQDQAIIIFGKILTYYFIIIGIVCVGFFTFANPVVRLLTAEGYYEAYKVVGFIALANFSQMLFNFFLPAFYFSKKVKFISVVQFISALISMPINYYLIYQYSVIGAAIGVFVGNMAMVILLFSWNNFYKYNDLKICYEWKRIVNIVFMLVLVVVAYSVLPVFSLNAEFVKSIIFVVLSIIFVFFLLNETERRFIKNIIELK